MSVRVVALDTTSAFGSLALVEDGAVVEESPLYSPEGFSHVLFPRLEQLLARHGWAYDSIATFAAAAGPGSFTGVRVGLAAVKGLAACSGAKAAGVSVLQAMAYLGSGEIRIPLLDARRGEVYAGLYSSGLKSLRPETVAPASEWVETLPQDARIITPEPEIFASVLTGRDFEKCPRFLAAAVGILGRNLAQDPAVIDANYVRRSDAELAWKESG